MSTTKFRIPVGIERTEMANVPPHAHGAVRNLISRVGGAFRFKDEAQLKQFTNQRQVPPELAQLVPQGKDAWTFLTAPIHTTLPPPRKTISQTAYA